MDRRSFVLRSVCAAVAVLCPQQPWTPKPGQLVRLVKYPPNSKAVSWLGAGNVIGPKAHPPANQLNEHYDTAKQLYRVDFGLMELECYADELRLV